MKSIASDLIKDWKLRRAERRIASLTEAVRLLQTELVLISSKYELAAYKWWWAESPDVPMITSCEEAPAFHDNDVVLIPLYRRIDE